MLREMILRRCESVMAARPPDFEIGPPGDRYMQRWHLTPWSTYPRGTVPKNLWEAFWRRLPNLYLHRFLHDDEDRALHDHPWTSVSWLLRGNYWEVLFVPKSEQLVEKLRAEGLPRPTTKVFRPQGSVNARGSETAHRVVLERDAAGQPVQAISLFFTGFKVREWGFHCPKAWRVWKEFVGERDKGAVGRGCE